MATIQEMQKARELMKNWLDLKTAVAQARTPVTPTSQINQDRLAQNQASRQANPVTPVTPTQPAPITPAPIVNAPVDQTTGLSKPLEPAVQPAPIPTPAQPVSTTKVDTTPWITQDAFQQAKAESEKIKAQNDAIMAQNQQKAELARQDEAMKAEALIPKDEKWVLNALISGASVPKQNTQAYRNAEFKANNFRKFNSMTPTQLLDNLKQGQISSEMDQLLSQNPNYTQAKQKLNEQQKITNLNKTMNNIVNWVKWKEVATTTPEQDEEDISIKLMQKYGLDDANAQAFSQFVATDEEMADNKAKLLANRNQLSSVNRQIADATKLFNDWVSQLKKDYPNISASAIITLMWSRLGEFNDAITNLNSTKTLLQADIKDEMDLAKSAYDAKSADIQSQNEIRKAMALNEYKSDFEKQQAEQALNDPAKAIKSVMDEYKKLGIPFTSTVQSRLAEFKASGKPLAQFLTEMWQNIQQSPAYQRIQAQEAGKWISYQTIGDKVYKNTNGVLTETGISAKKTAEPVWQEWEDASGKHAGWVTPWVQPSTATASAVKPTGNIVPVTAGNKTVRLDQVGAGGFENAINQLKSAWLSVVVWEGARDQTATIKSMADRYGIPFNASNPAETAQKLRSAGHQVADPWKSNHESGMAIDVYWNSKLDPVSPEQERILNANGWYSAGIPWDAGHFEYRGGTATQSTGSIANLWQFMKDNQQRWPWYSEEDVKAFNEKIDRFVKNWDKKWIATAFRNNLFQDKDFKQEFDNTKKFTTALDSVQTLLNDYEKAGKSTNALNWMAEKVARKLWLTTDQALAQLQTQMWFTLANYIKSISGTAASDVEVQRLMWNMANISNVKDLNTTILSQVKSNADSSLKSMIETRMYWMPEDLKYDVFADVYKKSAVNDKLSALTEILSKLTKNAPKQ